MLKNYLKIAFRNLAKHKAYSIINLLGLTIGLVSCILISLYVFDELNFDRFHSKAKRIYRLIETQASPDQGERQFGATVAPLGPTMVEEFPEVINYARVVRLGRLVVQYGENKFYEEFLAADPNLFEIFDFEFIAGGDKLFNDPATVILTEDAAQKYFGDENPIGKILNTNRGLDFKVAGVLRHLPQNSHLQFDMLFTLAIAQDDENRTFLQSWDVVAFQTYVLLDEHNNSDQVEAKLPALLNKYQPPESTVEKKVALQNLSDVHFFSENIEFERNYGKSKIAYIYIFATIAFFIVIIASINYMNLATARSANRANEVGLRKVVGAQPMQLVGQFISESMLMSFAAFLLAYALAQIILPQFNSFTGKELSFDLNNVGQLLFGLVSLTFIVGLASGSYPAFYLSKIPIISVLKSKFKSGSRANNLRRSLVVTQFVLSIIMIVTTLVTFNHVVGVVKDFHYNSLKEKIGPVMFSLSASERFVALKVNTKYLDDLIPFLEDQWNAFVPSYPFQFFFLDDHFDRMYQSEARLGSIFGTFALLAIIIACLGLFGLSAFTAESRTKEIGIRKVLGATVFNIVLLLSKDFVKLVIIGIVLLTPLAYYAMNSWLQNFAYRIELGLSLLMAAGGIALVIALLTVSFQAIKAAIANPVKSLRYE